MFEAQYRTKCKKCGKNPIIETRNYVSYFVEEFLISLVDVPMFYCDTCESITYRKDLEINNVLLTAYENDFNVVIFD